MRLARALFIIHQGDNDDDHTRQPPVLEHEDQDCDPHARHFCRPLLTPLLASRGNRRRQRLRFGTDPKDLEAVRKGFKSVLETDLVPQFP